GGARRQHAVHLRGRRQTAQRQRRGGGHRRQGLDRARLVGGERGLPLVPGGGAARPAQRAGGRGGRAAGGAEGPGGWHAAEAAAGSSGSVSIAKARAASSLAHTTAGSRAAASTPVCIVPKKYVVWPSFSADHSSGWASGPVAWAPWGSFRHAPPSAAVRATR